MCAAKATPVETTKDEVSSGGVEAVDRALSILRCFNHRDASLTLSDIAERTGFYKSTILRLAASLENAGFLIRRPDKNFTLGHELMRLGAVYQRSFKLENYVRPILKQVLASTGESASFFVRQGNRRVCLMREDSSHTIRDHVSEGDALSLVSGAASHVLKNPIWVAADQAQQRPAAAPVFSFGERDPDTAAGAVPIFGTINGKPALLGALAVSGPRMRFTPEAVSVIGQRLLTGGQELSTQLGGGTLWRRLVTTETERR